MSEVVCTTVYHSPCGPLLLGDRRGELCMCDWMEGAKHRGNLRRLGDVELQSAATPLLDEAARQLNEYFARRRMEFALQLNPVGTQFQRLVWRQLADVPYRSTISYGELARRVLLADGRGCGSNAAALSRSVGTALGANPISIIVPCHRIVGADGALRGYAGGIEAKRYLLQLEGAGL